MTREDIIKLANHQGVFDYFDLDGDSVGQLMLYTLVFDCIAAEREACAKVCEELVPNSSRQSYAAGVWDVATFDCAAAIRARGQHENS